MLGQIAAIGIAGTEERVAVVRSVICHREFVQKGMKGKSPGCRSNEWRLNPVGR
jgi:hypothetical protein